jgi:hypothetical protein
LEKKDYEKDKGSQVRREQKRVGSQFSPWVNAALSISVLMVYLFLSPLLLMSRECSLEIAIISLANFMLLRLN